MDYQGRTAAVLVLRGVPMTRSLKRFFILNLMVVYGLLPLAGCGSKEKVSEAPRVEVGVVPVTKGDVPISMEFVGRTSGAVDADVRARVEGVVEGIHFQEGTEVKEGQLLYSLDEAPLLAKVAEAKGTLAEALTRQDRADADLKRIKPLADINAVSKRELDAAIGQKGVADGAVDAAKAQVDAANIKLGYAKIKAPISGMIGLTKAKVGELVGSGPTNTTLNTVSQLDPTHVKFSVSEREYLYFAKLAQAQGPDREKRSLELVLADGSVHPQRGEVVSLDRNVDAQTGAINVEASFPNPTKILRPGLFAKVRTIAETVKGALLVPKRALKEIQGLYQVFVVNNEGVIDLRTIEVGVSSGDNRVVESGLQEGELVVVDGIQKVRAGQAVTVKRLN
jgi:membrane fusion protein (multidrug efflux system)